MSEEILLTQEGYDKIVAEHEELVSVKRKEDFERLKEAISYGDLSEIQNMTLPKRAGRAGGKWIIKLENMISKAKIINEDEMNIDRVSVGLRVKVQNVATKDEMEFTIVGSTEADPFEGKISNESEVGKSLLGKQKGETVEILVPDGTLEYKIIDITK